MALKIALLIPETLPSSDGFQARSHFISQLPDVLKKAGFEFTRHDIPIEFTTHGITPSTRTYHSLRTFFSSVEGVDLIHNLIGSLPLYFYPVPTAPVLSTFFEQPDQETLSLITSPPPLFFFTAVNETIQISGPNTLGTLPLSKIGEQIPALYGKIHALTRREDHRPWGYYVVLADEADHKVKRIVVWPEKRLSLQRHQRRSEHWHIVQGSAIVTLDDQHIPLKAGESVDIPKRAAHRIQNPSPSQDLVFVEIQRGDYFGEDDIERLEDDYGRA